VDMRVGWNRIERDRIRALRKRQDWLRNRVERSEADLSYDKAELAAITWVLCEIEKARGPLPPKDNNVI